MEVAMNMTAYDVEDLLIGVLLIRPYIDEHTALIGNDVVLCARIDDRHRHFHRSEILADVPELIIADPLYVWQRLIDSIHAFVACSMSRFPMGRHVEDHQPFLSNGGLHTRRLTDDGNVDGWQFGQRKAYPILSRHLLFSRGKINEIIALNLRCQKTEDLEQRAEAATTVVGAQSEEFSVLYQRLEGVASTS